MSGNLSEINVFLYSRLDESEIQTQNDNFESIWFGVCQPKSKKILCGAIYKTPDADPAAFTSWVEEIPNNVLTNDGEIVLIGDFNLNYFNPTSATKHFQQTTKSFHLKQSQSSLESLRRLEL